MKNKYFLNNKDFNKFKNKKKFIRYSFKKSQKYYQIDF